MKKTTLLILIVLYSALVLFHSCEKEAPPISGIELTETEISLFLDEVIDLNVIVYPNNAEIPVFSWTSSDETIVSVSEAGKLKALSIGEATIIVYTPGNLLEASCKVEVLPVTPTAISINLSSLDLVIEDEAKLSCIFIPENTTYKDVIWISDDPLIVSVDSIGNVKANGIGETNIRVTTKDNQLEAVCTISVLPINATSISLSETSLELLIGEESALTYTISPDNTTYKEVHWFSGNESVATVNQDGIVNAISVGKTKITIQTENSLVTAECDIEVKPIEVESVSFDHESLQLFVGESFILNCIVLPENATNKNVTMSSTDESIATVDNYGNIQALKAGFTEIRATSDNSITDICALEIKNVSPISISLNKTSTVIEIEETETLIVELLPVNTTNKQVTWSSSDLSIVSVNEQGQIKGIHEGTALISVISEDNSLVAVCNVEVKLNGLVLTKTSIITLPNQQENISVLYITSRLNYLSASWSSSNPSVAVAIDGEEGMGGTIIQTKEIGTTTITATSADGSKSASCQVDVKDITDFIDLSFIATGIVNINGFIFGDIYSEILNSSMESILLTELSVYDGNTNELIAYTNDPSKLGTLYPGYSRNLGMKFDGVYKPIFVWKIEWDGNIYEINHQFSAAKKSYASPDSRTELNLITD